jgi:hypothetical protein
MTRKTQEAKGSLMSLKYRSGRDAVGRRVPAILPR